MRETKNSTLAIFSVLFAGLAILLSQLPPVLFWKPHRTLELRHADEFFITSDLGVLTYNVGFEIENTGNRRLTITSLLMEIIGPDGTERQIPVYSFQRWESAYWLPFTSARIEPGESWSKLVAFTRPLSPSQEKQRSDIVLAFQNSYWEQYNKFVSAGDEGTYQFDQGLVRQATDFFSRNFYLEEGEYKVRFFVRTKEAPQAFEFHSTFILYENQVRLLAAEPEQYSEGRAILFSRVIPGGRTQMIRLVPARSAL